MEFIRKAAGIVLVLLVAVGLAASGAAHKAFHSHHEGSPHQACQLCILGGTPPAPPARPRGLSRLPREWTPPSLPSPPERAPLYRLPSRAPPSL